MATRVDSRLAAGTILASSFLGLVAGFSQGQIITKNNCTVEMGRLHGSLGKYDRDENGELSLSEAVSCLEREVFYMGENIWWKDSDGRYVPIMPIPSKEETEIGAATIASHLTNRLYGLKPSSVNYPVNIAKEEGRKLPWVALRTFENLRDGWFQNPNIIVLDELPKPEGS